jgi:hypothetical protein
MVNLRGIVMSRRCIVSAIAATIALATVAGGASALAAGPENSLDSFRGDYSMRQNDGIGQISDVYLPSRSPRFLPLNYPVWFQLCRLADYIAISANHTQTASHSRSFDHRRRARPPLTAIPSAFRCPTSTSNRLPRVTPCRSGSAAASGSAGC